MTKDHPLRVAMLSFFFPPRYSGAGLQALALARELRRQGVESLFLTSGGRLTWRRDEMEGFPVWRLPGLAWSLRLSVVLYWLGSFLTLAWNRSRVDAVHVHSSGIDGIAAGLFAHLFHKPCLVKTTLLASDLSPVGRGLLGRLHSWYLRRAEWRVATSEEARQEWRALGFEDRQILLLPNGVDTRRFRPATEEEKRRLKAELGQPAPRIAVFTGCLTRRKGIDILVRAWARVRRALPDAQLLLVGPWAEPHRPLEFDPGYHREVMDSIAAEGLQGAISQVGMVERVEDYLRVGDLFVFASRQEGLPNALLEAMATALPAVALRIAGTEGLLEPGVDGCLIEPEDVEAFAAACVKLLSDPRKRSEMGDRARAKIEDRYAIERIAATYIEAYRRRGGEAAVPPAAPPGT